LTAGTAATATHAARPASAAAGSATAATHAALATSATTHAAAHAATSAHHGLTLKGLCEFGFTELAIGILVKLLDHRLGPRHRIHLLHSRSALAATHSALAAASAASRAAWSAGLHCRALGLCLTSILRHQRQAGKTQDHHRDMLHHGCISLNSVLVELSLLLIQGPGKPSLPSPI
jgi:hypothetical protein